MNLCHESHNTRFCACFERLRPLLVTLLLLVFITASGWTCDFSEYKPISTVYEVRITTLLDYLPLDYPMSIISNLQMDSWCSELWNLYFMRKELERMVSIAGKSLIPLIKNVTEWELFLFDHCNFTESSDCQRNQYMNISAFLKLLTEQMKALNFKINHDFSNCSTIMCLANNSLTEVPSQEPSSTSSVAVTDQTTDTVPYSNQTVTPQPSNNDAFIQMNSTADPEGNKRVRLSVLAPVCCAVVIPLIAGCRLLRPWKKQDSNFSDPESNLSARELETIR